MKKLHIIVLILMISFASYGQEYYYWYKGEKIPLYKGTQSYILCDSQKMRSDETLRLKEWGNTSVGETIKWGIIDDTLRTTTNSIVYQSPSFFCSDTTKNIFVTHRFYVKLKSIQDTIYLHDMVSQYNAVIESEGILPSMYIIRCGLNTKFNALDLANRFYESELFEWTEPEFIHSIYPSSTCVNDVYFPNQWNLENTGQQGTSYEGIDINYCNARSITSGSSSVIVGVLDWGVDLNHADINIYPLSYNAHTLSSPSLIYDRHGTAVAGIISARSNNTIGVAGIASNCPIMSISMDGSTPPSRVASGIDFAVSSGCSVINNSWSSETRSNTIEEAIFNAINNGRNGKGCVVTFATGNDNGNVDYPASAFPEILTVGAITPNGERKTPYAFDNLQWGSNYGPTIDVVAPGIFIYTTDIVGANGYTTYDYISTFWGTSAACPHVSAIAALMLSVNPYLTQKEVVDIIESTAQKVGGYDYQNNSNHPNGTWNDHVGYGLVNAYAAVSEAKSRYIQGPNEICDGDTAKYYLIHPLQQGETVAWTTYSGMNLSPVFSIVGSSTQDTVYVRCRYIDSRLLDPIDPRKYLSATITNTTTGTSDTYIKILSQAHSEVPTISASNTSTLWFSQTPRTFTVTNCNDVPDSLLQWTVIRKGTTPPPPLHPTIHTYNYYGRTLTYSPPSPPSISRPDTLTIYATNLAGVCGAVNSNSMRFVVAPRKILLNGNVDGQQLDITIMEDSEDSQRLMAQLDEDSNYTLELWHSIYGAMRVQTVYNANEQMSISGLPQGVYVLSLKENGIIIAQTKVQIE